MVNKCTKCAVKFTRGDRKVGCRYCGGWFHLECGNVTEKMFELMEENPQIHWYCVECNGKATDVLAVVKNCVKENEDLKKMTELEAALKSMKEGADEEFEENNKKLTHEEAIKNVVKKEVDKNLNFRPVEQNPSTEAVREIAKKEVRENNDKKGREGNIVIANIDEEKDETKEVEDLLKYLDVTVEVNGIRRLGKEKQEGKNRQVWVKLSGKTERNEVLENANKMRNDDRWRDVYINRDMTEEERKDAYNLRVELRKRRQEEEAKSGSTKFVIYRGKVIKKGNLRETDDEEDGIQTDE